LVSIICAGLARFQTPASMNALKARLPRRGGWQGVSRLLVFRQGMTTADELIDVP
jgi:hypothetical protein